MPYDREYYTKAFPFFDEEIIDVIVAYQQSQDMKEKGALIVDADGSETPPDQQPRCPVDPRRPSSVPLSPSDMPEAFDDVCGCKEYPASV